jgi:hypothetical protein
MLKQKVGNVVRVLLAAILIVCLSSRIAEARGPNQSIRPTRSDVSAANCMPYLQMTGQARAASFPPSGFLAQLSWQSDG